MKHSQCTQKEHEDDTNLPFPVQPQALDLAKWKSNHPHIEDNVANAMQPRKKVEVDAMARRILFDVLCPVPAYRCAGKNASGDKGDSKDDVQDAGSRQEAMNGVSRKDAEVEQR